MINQLRQTLRLMSKISFDRIIPLLTNQEHLDGVLGMLREILVLQDKLDNPKRQDFYFQKGISNHISHLESLKNEYAKIVEIVNNNSVDYFLGEVNERKEKVQKLTSKGYLNTIDQMALGMIKGEISKFQNLLEIKGRFGTLKPLDELMQDESALMEIFS